MRDETTAACTADVRASKQIGGGSRARRMAMIASSSGRELTGAAAAQDLLDPGDQLLGMARLGDPVIRAAPQRAHSIGDRRGIAADEQRQAGKRMADPLDVVEPGQRRIDDQRVETPGLQLVRSGCVRERLAIPAQSREPPVEHGQQTAVFVDERDPDTPRIDWRCHLPSSVRACQDTHELQPGDLPPTTGCRAPRRRAWRPRGGLGRILGALQAGVDQAPKGPGELVLERRGQRRLGGLDLPFLELLRIARPTLGSWLARRPAPSTARAVTWTAGRPASPGRAAARSARTRTYLGPARRRSCGAVDPRARSYASPRRRAAPGRGRRAAATR